MRLDAMLSRFGYCSRKEAASWIKNKRILVKGAAASAAKQKAEPCDVIVDGEPIDSPDGLYIALNKPTGCTCSHSSEEGDLVYDLLPEQWLRRNPPVTTVGRLDKETSGLLLLTDDGQFVHRHTSPKHHIAKVYEFETETPIPEQSIPLFKSGTLLLTGESTPCLPADLELTAPNKGRLVLYEGRYHQVRRMLDHVGAPIVTLNRVAIGSLKLDDLGLEPGEWMPVNPDDIA